MSHDLFSQKNPQGEYKRPERVADQIRMIVSDILITKAADPRLHGVSILHVDLSPDLMQARLFISTPQEEKEALRGLKKAAGFIRSELARNMKLRRVPVLTFVADPNEEKRSRLLCLLDSVGQELSPPEEEHPSLLMEQVS